MKNSINAYHMIGTAQRGDAARLYDTRYTEQVLSRIAELHQSITKSGFLLPAANRAASQGSRTFAMDKLAGDDQFVFLSAGVRYWNEDIPEANFGFIFDLESLLKEGAILRTRDLLAEYEDLLDDAIEEQAEDYDDDGLMLLRAVESLNWSNPLVAEIMTKLQSQFAALQRETHLKGKQAMQAAQQDGGSGDYEILVAGRLPISKAIATIERGIEIPTSQRKKGWFSR